MIKRECTFACGQVLCRKGAIWWQKRALARCLKLAWPECTLAVASFQSSTKGVHTLYLGFSSICPGCAFEQIEIASCLSFGFQSRLVLVAVRSYSLAFAVTFARLFFCDFGIHLCAKIQLAALYAGDCARNLFRNLFRKFFQSRGIIAGHLCMNGYKIWLFSGIGN